MCDEFSMLIATFIVFYRLLSFSQTRFSPNVLLYSLLMLMGTVIIAQFTTGESTVQQIVFTGMVYWLWNTCFKLISNLESDDILKSRMRWMAVSGIGKLFDILFDLISPLTAFLRSFLYFWTCMLGHRLLRM